MTAVNAYESPVHSLSLDAAADLSSYQYHAIALDSNGAAALPTAAGQRCIGILQNAPAAAGRAAEVMDLGVSKALLGGTVAAGDYLACDSSGHIIKAIHYYERFAIALSSGSSGGVIPVMVMPGLGKRKPVRISHHVNLAGVSAADVVTTITPGFAGSIEKLYWVQGTPVTTGSKAATLNAEIGTTDVTGGAVALTSATCTPLGAVIAGTAVTAANEFTATDTISIEASSVTAFSEGDGDIVIECSVD